MVSAQPLVGKVATLEAAEEKLSKQVGELRKKIGIAESGIAESGSETETVETASMLQQESTPTTLHRSKARPGIGSYMTHPVEVQGPKTSSVAGLIDATMAAVQTPEVVEDT